MFKLARKVVSALQILLPIFSVSAFLLGAEHILPGSSLAELVVSAIVMFCAVMAPVIMTSKWPRCERVLLMGNVIASNVAYGTQVLPFRANLSALFVALFVTGVVKALGYGSVCFRYVVLPIGALSVLLLVLLLIAITVSYYQVVTTDSLVTVCRGFEKVASSVSQKADNSSARDLGLPSGEYMVPIYEAWPAQEAMEKFTYLNGDGRALTEEEALTELFSMFIGPRT